MRNILAIGGTGFVGWWLNKSKPSDVRLICIGSVDYASGNWLSEEWDAIFFLAHTTPRLALNYAVRKDIRVLFASSGIYYYPENNIQYRQDKLEYEAECWDSQANVVVARLFTFSGVWLDDSKAIVQFYKAARLNQTVVITGNGDTIRSYMPGLVMGEWLWAIMDEGEDGEAYDVGSDMPITILQLAKSIIQKLHSISDIVVLGGNSPMPVYLPKDTRKTKILLEKKNANICNRP